MVERRKACTKYFWLFFYETPNLVRGYAASFTGQDFSRSNNLQAMNSVPQVFLGPGLRGQLFGGGQFRNLAKSIFWSAATGQAFALVKTGHPFSLVSGARSAEKILLLQP